MCKIKTKQKRNRKKGKTNSNTLYYNSEKTERVENYVDTC